MCVHKASGVQLLAGGSSGLLTSSFAPFGRSSREAHAEILLGALEKYIWPYLNSNTANKEIKKISEIQNFLISEADRIAYSSSRIKSHFWNMVETLQAWRMLSVVIVFAFLSVSRVAHWLCLCDCHCLLSSQDMSYHQSDQMSQSPKGYSLFPYYSSPILVQILWGIYVFSSSKESFRF